ncbi:hypothetical protein [Wolbachia endosymbiont of Pentidionis agamae]|uniref:hypothetical protein n=1 Tax=Wolbachia endosymbiont of Pentidionis agamae TaxID=3110435 RepID=UPI002FD503D4
MKSFSDTEFKNNTLEMYNNKVQVDKYEKIAKKMSKILDEIKIEEVSPMHINI